MEINLHVQRFGYAMNIKITISETFINAYFSLVSLINTVQFLTKNNARRKEEQFKRRQSSTMQKSKIQ